MQQIEIETVHFSKFLKTPSRLVYRFGLGDKTTAKASKIDYDRLVLKGGGAIRKQVSL